MRSPRITSGRGRVEAEKLPGQEAEGTRRATSSANDKINGGGDGDTAANQAPAAVTPLYEHGPAPRLAVKRARVPEPGAPDAPTRAQGNAVRRAADRHGPRDAALIALLLGARARAENATA